MAATGHGVPACRCVLDYGGARGTAEYGRRSRGQDDAPIILRWPLQLAKDAIATALGNPDAGEKEVEAVVSIFGHHDTLRTTMDRAERHAEAARAALASLPASLERDILFDVPEFCTQRAY